MNWANQESSWVKNIFHEAQASVLRDNLVLDK